MIKLIVSDMDGTLLDDNKKLHDDFWEVFDELKKEKYILFLPVGDNILISMNISRK